MNRNMNLMMAARSPPPPPVTIPCQHRRMTLTANDESFAFTCNGCREMGYGECYQCTELIQDCNFHLHKECITASPTAYHPFFPQLLFILHNQPLHNGSEICQACDMETKGLKYVYSWAHGSIYLHPCCMQLPYSIPTDDGDVLNLTDKLQYTACQYCERTTLGGPVDGWAYLSSDQQYSCHVKCMKESLFDEWNQARLAENLQGECWLNNMVTDPHNGLAMTRSRLANPSSTGRKRRILWKLTKASAKILLHFATGNHICALDAFHGLFFN